MSIDCFVNLFQGNSQHCNKYQRLSYKCKFYGDGWVVEYVFRTIVFLQIPVQFCFWSLIVGVFSSGILNHIVQAGRVCHLIRELISCWAYWYSMIMMFTVTEGSTDRARNKCEVSGKPRMLCIQQEVSFFLDHFHCIFCETDTIPWLFYITNSFNKMLNWFHYLRSNVVSWLCLKVLAWWIVAVTGAARHTHVKAENWIKIIYCLDYKDRFICWILIVTGKALICFY